ncbi:hypothetical protein [Pseudooceanicola sp. 200-1SW]|uniref:hypothetical protein n=1 Tax=Pseudooceanicola sp. 200-1SW TaxID=3425949 RepID=UPI003D7FF63C
MRAFRTARLLKNRLPAAPVLAVPALALAAAAAALLASPAPVAAQAVIETDTAKIFEQRWMQSKEADKNGLLMYLDEQRALTGDYLSIRCEEGARSVRLGFGTARPQLAGGQAEAQFIIDGQATTYRLGYTGTTPDPAISQGDIHGYRMLFASASERDGFLAALQRGSELRIEGQALPISLAGSGQAISEQAGYCR